MECPGISLGHCVMFSVHNYLKLQLWESSFPRELTRGTRARTPIQSDLGPHSLRVDRARDVTPHWRHITSLSVGSAS